jgi:hypothetical protein
MMSIIIIGGRLRFTNFLQRRANMKKRRVVVRKRGVVVGPTTRALLQLTAQGLHQVLIEKGANLDQSKMVWRMVSIHRSPQFPLPAVRKTSVMGMVIDSASMSSSGRG